MQYFYWNRIFNFWSLLDWQLSVKSVPKDRKGTKYFCVLRGQSYYHGHFLILHELEEIECDASFPALTRPGSIANQIREALKILSSFSLSVLGHDIF